MGVTPLHIMHVLHSYLPYSTGGIEVYVGRLAKVQSRENQVSIFHPILDPRTTKYAITSEDQEGIQLHRIVMNDFPKVRQGELYDGMLLNRFQELVADIKPDVIHYHSLINLSICLLSPDIRVPKIFTLHDFWLMCPRVVLVRTDESLCQGPERGLLCVTCRDPAKEQAIGPISFLKRSQRLRRRLVSYNFEEMMFDDKLFQHHFRDSYALDKIRYVDRFIVLSKFYRERYGHWGIESNKFMYLPLGVDSTYLSTVQHLPSNKVRFGFIGRIERLKGVHLLIEAFNRLEVLDSELVLYGSFAPPEYEPVLKRMVRRNGIRFMGAFDPAEIGNVLASIDVLVLPSIVPENCPLVVLEALAANIPVIVSDSGGEAELVEIGKGGWHFARGNVESLTSQMQELVRNPPLIQQMREKIRPVKTIEQNARETLEQYMILQGNRA